MPPTVAGAATLRSITGDGTVTRKASATTASVRSGSAASRSNQPDSVARAANRGTNDTSVSVPVSANAATAPSASASVSPSSRIRPGTVAGSPIR